MRTRSKAVLVGVLVCCCPLGVTPAQSGHGSRIAEITGDGVSSSHLFSDGFESGETDQWSTTRTGELTTVVGAMTGADSGLPLENVELKFFDQTDQALTDPVVTLTTAGDGSFIGVVPGGDYYIGAYPPPNSQYAPEFYPGVPPYYDTTGEGWQPTPIDGESVDLGFTLHVGGTIAVQLLNPEGGNYTGAVVPNLLVLGDGSCGSGCHVGTYYLDLTSGFVETPLIPPGDYVLNLNPEEPLTSQYYCGAFFLGDASVITLESGEALQLLDCALAERPTVDVSGQVSSDQMEGIPAVVVTFIPTDNVNNESFIFTTDGSGGFGGTVNQAEYYIEYLPPIESRYPWAFYPGTPPYYDPDRDGIWEAISVTPENDQFDVVLPLGARLQFSVNASDGNPNQEEFSPHLRLVEFSPCDPVDCVSPYAVYPLPASTSEVVTSWVLPGDYVFAFNIGAEASVPDQYYCGALAEDVADVLRLEAGDELILPTCTLATEPPRYTIAGRVTDGNGDPVPGIQIIAEPQSGDATQIDALSGEDGVYELEAEGSFHTVRAAPDPSTWLADEWYPDAYCPYYADMSLNWRPMFEYLSADQDYSNIDFELEAGGIIELEGLLGGDQTTIGFPVSGAITYLHQADEIDEVRPDHSNRNYLQVCRSFETDASGRMVSPVLREHGYSITFGFPDPDSGYIAQGYCQVPDGQIGDHISVATGETTLLAECELITDEYQVRTSEGTMFSFDENWNGGVGWLYGHARAADLNNDGLKDFVLAGVGGGYDEECGAGTTFGTGIMVFINQGGNQFEDRTQQWTGDIDFGFCNGLGPALADLDGDGFQDLVLVGSSIEWADRPWGQQDEVWRNIDGDHFEDKTGEWIPLDDNPGADGFLSGDFAVADLDGDGDPDLVRTMNADGGQILLNDGSGVLEDVTDDQNLIDPDVLYLLSVSTWGVDLSDINDDENIDMLAVRRNGDSSPVVAFMGRGDGFFEMAEPDGILVDPFPGDWIHEYASLEAIDLDGDDFREIYLGFDLLSSSDCLEQPLAACRSNELDRMYSVTSVVDGVPSMADVTGNLEQSTAFNKSSRVRSADIDNDGDVDLIVANFAFGVDQFTHPEYRILLNDGAGNMSMLEKEAFPSFTASGGDVEIFDSDNDGDLDLLLCGSPVVLLVNKTISPPQ